MKEKKKRNYKRKIKKIIKKYERENSINVKKDTKENNIYYTIRIIDNNDFLTDLEKITKENINKLIEKYQKLITKEEILTITNYKEYIKELKKIIGVM